MVFDNKLAKCIKYAGITAIVTSLTACAGNLVGSREENTRLETYTNRVLDAYFTKPAQLELKEIPVSFANFPSQMAHAIGFANVNMMTAMWSGMGYSPITVFNVNKKEKLMDDLVVHEFTHHAIERDLIDFDKFKIEWDLMSNDPKYSNACKVLNTKISEQYGNLNMSENEIMEERLAYFTKVFILVPSELPKGLFDVYSSLLTPPKNEEEIKKQIKEENK